MLRFFANLAGTRTKWILLAWLVASIPVVAGISRLEAKTSQRDLVPPRYESSRTLDHMDEKFGKISSEDIVLEGVDMTSFPMVKKLMLLEEELAGELGEERVQGVNTYLGDFVQGVKQETGFTSIGTLFSFYPETSPVQDPNDPSRTISFSEALVRGVETMLADPVNQEMIIRKGGMLSEDRQAARVIIVLAPETEPGQNVDSADKVERFAAAYFAEDPDLDGLQVWVAGDPSLEKDLRHYIIGNTLVLLLISILIMAAILYFTFWRLSDVALCLLVLFLSVAWIFGLMGWFNIPFTLISVAIAPLILGINIADVVYFMSRFYEEMHEGRDARGAAGHTILTVGVAVFLAAVSTIFGFASFGFSDLTTIRQFGLMACIGEVVGFMMSVTLLPAVMVWREERRGKKERHWAHRKRIFARGSSSRLDAALHWTAGASSIHPAIILTFTGAVVAACFLGATRLDTTSDLRNLIPQGLEAIKAQHEEERLFGGQQTDFILLTGDLFTPEAMRAMHDFEEDLGAQPYFTRDGITTLEDIMSAALAGTQGTDLLGLATADQVEAAYQSVKDYIPSEILTADGATTLVSINSLAAPTSDVVDQKRQTLQDTVSATFAASGLEHETGGMTPLTADLLGNLVPTQVLTSVFALVLSGLVLMLIFRSILLGLATLSVLAASIAVEIGFLALINWPLDMMTVLVTSMVIGVGIDFGIHVTWRFLEEYGHRENTAREALEITLTSVGRPIVAAALSAAGAFFILVFTEIMPIRRFGGVTAISLVVGLLSTLLILPSMLALITRHSKKFMAMKAGPPEEGPESEMVPVPVGETT